MRRFALIALAALLWLGLVATPVSAGKGWCRSDPVVQLGSNVYTLEVTVNFPDDGSGYATGPTVWRIFHSTNPASIVAEDDYGVDGEAEYAILLDGSSDWVVLFVYTNGSFEEQVTVNGTVVWTGTTSQVAEFSLG